ncbi:MAG: Hsp20/alpha crystallin family protein, partial [Candidatus Micrarchaeaceae archaeon]
MKSEKEDGENKLDVYLAKNIVRRMNDLIESTMDSIAGHGFMEELLDRDFTMPKVDIIDNAQSIICRVELPGIDKKNIKVSVSNDELTIKAE